MKNIILFGTMGSGKSTIAGLLKKVYPSYTVVSFAAKLKSLTHTLMGLENSPIELQLPFLTCMLPPRSEISEKALREFIENFHAIPTEKIKQRRKYQYVGEGLRNLMGESIWVNELLRKINDEQIFPFVVDDGRHVNEAVMARSVENTVTVKLELDEEERLRRLKRIYPSFDVSLLEHPSEVQVANAVTDFTLKIKNDDTPLSVLAALDKLLDIGGYGN